MELVIEILGGEKRRIGQRSAGTIIPFTRLWRPPRNWCCSHLLLSSALMLYDKYLFSLSIILRAEIMHFAVPTPQMPGMHQHLYPLNTLLSFSSFPFFPQRCILSLFSHSLIFFLGAFFGANDTAKSWCRRLMAVVLWRQKNKKRKNSFQLFFVLQVVD